MQFKFDLISLTFADRNKYFLLIANHRMPDKQIPVTGFSVDLAITGIIQHAEKADFIPAFADMAADEITSAVIKSTFCNQQKPLPVVVLRY